MPTVSNILLIEDSPGECELFRLALAQTGLDVFLYAEHDAETALHFLSDRHRQSSMRAGSWPIEPGGSNGLPIARPATAAPSATHSEPAGDLATLPFVILLDWHLQKTRGDQFLVRLRSDARFLSTPVVVFTTSDDVSDMAAGYRCGANGYVVKPGTFDELVHCIGDLCGYWMQWNRTLPGMTTAC